MKASLLGILLLSAVASDGAESYLRVVGTNLFDFSLLLSGALNSNATKFVVRGTVQTNTKYGTYVLDARLRVAPKGPSLYGNSRSMLMDLAAAQVATREMSPGAWYAMSPELRSRLTPYWDNRDLIVSNFPAGLPSKEVYLFAVPSGRINIPDTKGVFHSCERFDYGTPFTGKLTDFKFLLRVSTNGIVRARIPTEQEVADEKAATQRRLVSWRLVQATNGLPSFQHDVGMMYLNGDGVPKSAALALHWFRAAATNQHGPSIVQLKELTNSVSSGTDNRTSPSQ